MLFEPQEETYYDTNNNDKKQNIILLLYYYYNNQKKPVSFTSCTTFIKAFDTIAKSKNKNRSQLLNELIIQCILEFGDGIIDLDKTVLEPIKIRDLSKLKPESEKKDSKIEEAKEFFKLYIKNFEDLPSKSVDYAIKKAEKFPNLPEAQSFLELVKKGDV